MGNRKIEKGRLSRHERKGTQKIRKVWGNFSSLENYEEGAEAANLNTKAKDEKPSIKLGSAG